MAALTFPGWLQTQLNHRRWTQADLAQRSGISQAAVSRVLSGSRQPGVDFCSAISTALELPEEQVFQEAGLLRPSLPDDYTAAELYLIQLYREAPDLLRAAAYAVLTAHKR